MTDRKTQRTLNLTKDNQLTVHIWSQGLLTTHPKSSNTGHAEDTRPDQSVLCCEVETKKQTVLLLSCQLLCHGK